MVRDWTIRRWRGAFRAAVLRDVRGATALEFALVAPVLIAMIVAIFEIAVMYFAQQGLETATETAARLILTGQAQQNFTGVKDAQGNVTKTPQQQFKEAACASLPTFLQCSRLYVDVTNVTNFSSANTALPTFTYDSNGNITNSFAYSPGAQGAVVVVRLIYNWPTLAGPLGFDLSNRPGSQRMLLATSVMKTEGY